MTVIKTEGGELHTRLFSHKKGLYPLGLIEKEIIILIFIYFSLIYKYWRKDIFQHEKCCEIFWGRCKITRPPTLYPSSSGKRTNITVQCPGQALCSL